jgi:adenylate cyclase
MAHSIDPMSSMTLSDVWEPFARALIGDPEFTSVEVADAAGVDLEQARRLWRALGFPPVPIHDRVFTRSDVAMLGAVRSLLEQGMAEPGTLVQLTRVTGQSLARVAEAQVAATAGRLELGRGDPATGRAVEPFIELTKSLVPSVESFLNYAWRRHLVAALFRLAASDGMQPTTDRRVAVGFADLVGFTAMSQQLSDDELAAIVDRFEALAYAHIPERGGRVVKTIGDEVMFTVEDSLVAAEIALALVEAYAGDDTLPDVRVGVAAGPVVSWEGDLFGPTVNLASRLVNMARPGTVLVSDDLGTELQPCSSLTLLHLRAVPLKGIGRVRLWVLRRASDPSVAST